MAKKLIGLYKPNLGSPEEIRKSSEEIYKDVMSKINTTESDKKIKKPFSKFRSILGRIRKGN